MIFNVNSGAGKTPINVVPSTNSSFTYNGSAQTPLWQNFDQEQLSISGATSATNAGTYKVYFTPKADYEWSDGTTAAKTATWSIAKASGSLSLSATSATIIGKNNTKTFTVTRAGDGKISASSSNTGIATAAVSGTTVTITAKGYGSATITVSVAAGTNHTAPGSKTYSVTVDYLYLYKDGNENTAVTGGWITEEKYISSDGYNKNALTITRNSTNMVIQQTKNYYGGIAYCKNKIDITNYTKLVFQGTLDTSDGDHEKQYCLNVWSSFGKYYEDNRAAAVDMRGTGNTTKNVDVSNVSGSHYIGFGSFRTGTITMTKLYLE